VTNNEKEKRMLKKVVEECVMCPMHTCFDNKCRCKEVDRVIPQGIMIQMGFPEWCPLEKVK